MVFWNIEMRDRVGVVLPLTLLANEHLLETDRIARERPSVEDEQAGRPGRLVSIDISRGNFGSTKTRGTDVSLQKRFSVGQGTIEPRMDVTYTDEFRYSTLPTRIQALRDRVGVASEFGTITPWRAVGCLKYEDLAWRLNVCGRYHSAYADYIATLGVLSGRDIPSSTRWDINISRSLSKHLTMTLGAFDVLNEGAPFAEIGDAYGFDTSQADLEERTIFLKMVGSL